LQNKNADIQAIDEYIKMKEELKEYGISTQDIGKLLNLLANAKEYGFDTKKIVARLCSIRRLEKKRERLKNNCEMLYEQMQKYKKILPLTEDMAALDIGIDELIALKATINQAVKLYNLPPLAATLRIIDDIKKYDRMYGLKRELERLSLQKFAITEACSRQGESLIALAKLKSHGITEDRILNVNNLLWKKGYNLDMILKS
jgi:hypothetical protein